MEVFVTAYRKIPEKKTPVRPWLFTIARFDCLRAWRNAIRQGKLILQHEGQIRDNVHLNPPVSEDSEVTEERELNLLRESLARLHKRDRELIEQRFLERRTFEQLAKEYYRAESTIRARLDKALARLRDIYRKIEENNRGT